MLHVIADLGLAKVPIRNFCDEAPSIWLGLPLALLIGIENHLKVPMTKALERTAHCDAATGGQVAHSSLERAFSLQPVVGHVARWGVEAGRVILVGQRVGLAMARRMARGAARSVVELEAMPFGALGPRYPGSREQRAPVVVVAGIQDLDALAMSDIALAARCGSRVALFTDAAGAKLAGQYAAACLTLRDGEGLVAGQRALLALLEIQLLRARLPAPVGAFS